MVYPYFVFDVNLACEERVSGLWWIKDLPSGGQFPYSAILSYEPGASRTIIVEHPYFKAGGLFETFVTINGGDGGVNASGTGCIAKVSWDNGRCWVAMESGFWDTTVTGFCGGQRDPPPSGPYHAPSVKVELVLNGATVSTEYFYTVFASWITFPLRICVEQSYVMVSLFPSGYGSGACVPIVWKYPYNLPNPVHQTFWDYGNEDLNGNFEAFVAYGSSGQAAGSADSTLRPSLSLTYEDSPQNKYRFKGKGDPKACFSCSQTRSWRCPKGGGNQVKVVLAGIKPKPGNPDTGDPEDWEGCGAGQCESQNGIYYLYPLYDNNDSFGMNRIPHINQNKCARGFYHLRFGHDFSGTGASGPYLDILATTANTTTIGEVYYQLHQSGPGSQATLTPCAFTNVNFPKTQSMHQFQFCDWTGVTCLVSKIP